MSSTAGKHARVEGEHNTGPDPPAKRAKIDYTDLIKVVVGRKEQVLHVPRTVLCSSSRFFAAALERYTWLESTEKRVVLPEADADLFNTYLHWLMKGEVSLPTIANNDLDEFEPLCKLWILGNSLADTSFRNRMLDAIIDEYKLTDYVLNGTTLSHVWENSNKDAAIRRVCVDMFCAVEPEYLTKDHGSTHAFLSKSSARPYSETGTRMIIDHEEAGFKDPTTTTTRSYDQKLQGMAEQEAISS